MHANWCIEKLLNYSEEQSFFHRSRTVW
jgi:hypothetical protein